MGFTVRTDEPFGDVEDEVRPQLFEAEIGLLVGLNRENVMFLAERSGYCRNSLV